VRRINLSILLVALVVTIFGFSGAAECDEPIVKVENLGDTLVFHPTVDFRQLILTVTGPCDFQYRQVVEKGQPFFRLNDETIDGAYTYGVTRMPFIDREIIELLQKARLKQDDSVARRLCRDGRLPGPPMIQSGGFMVSRGEIIFDPGSVEDKVVTKQLDAGALNGQMSIETSYEIIARDGTVAEKAGSPDKDFVINDDLIVDGSACIGFDCVNGESFGFDTIRLKENNLRIKFDDTSTLASYPRNDWQLTANDSANGGASKFSIDDISGNRTPFTVEANARSHSLYVDDGGRIGSRTSTPSVELHTIDGDTPTLRLQQDGSSGFAPQTWDVAGNETNFFIRDVTNGSQLPFRIRPDAPTNSVFIDVDGEVGFGTSSPDAAVDIENNSGAGFRLTNTGSGGGTWDFFVNANTSRFNIEFNDGNIPFKIDDGADNNLLQVGIVASDQVDINGDLVVSGTITPDYVFEPGYQLESIEEHAEYMWTNKHLPAVGAAMLRPDGSHAVNVGARSQSMLEELEKAHIYIEQLHATVKELQSEQQLREQASEAQIEQLQVTILSLQDRLEKLEKDTVD
jgi:hypothetical protein